MRRVVVAVVLPCVLVIAGCGDGEPDDDSAASPNQSPSESASVSESASPEKQAWQKRTKAGAKAFVRRWVDGYNSSLSTGKVQAIEQLSAPGCRLCAALIQDTHSIYSNGGKIEGGEWQTVEFGTVALRKNFARLTSEVSISEQRLRESEGAQTVGYKPAKQRYFWQLEWDGAWSVESMRSL